MVVGIISREAPGTYRWLIDFLHSFLSEREVQSVCINNSSQIHPENYTFTILYHSKTRGRVNVTDVTDSLYDDELRQLSKTLGKRNVIVVIDDLDNNSNEEKNRILSSQPSIGEMARELFLFTSGVKLSSDTNQVNFSNKQRMRQIIEGATVTPTLRIAQKNQMRTMMNINLILIVPTLFILLIWWYNVWVLQW